MWYFWGKLVIYQFFTIMGDMRVIRFLVNSMACPSSILLKRIENICHKNNNRLGTGWQFSFDGKKDVEWKMSFFTKLGKLFWAGKRWPVSSSLKYRMANNVSGVREPSNHLFGIILDIYFSSFFFSPPPPHVVTEFDTRLV